MKTGCWMSGVVIFIIGGLIGAGIMYQVSKCKVQQTSIQLDSSGNAPALTITKTGNGQ